jgi:endonuclease G
MAACASQPESTANLFISHCLAACPTGTAVNNEIIVRHLYAVSVSADTRLADWVSYRVLPGGLGVASLLPREWQDDELTRFGYQAAELEGQGNTLVRTGTGDQADSAYRVTDFQIDASDRGRLVPMTSFAGTSFWSDLNLLSIMSMMKSDMRLASWARLDQAINQLVEKQGEIYVVTGPVYGDRIDPSAGADAYMPQAFFKVVASPDGRLAAFLFDQDLPVHAVHCDQASDLGRIESLTGLRIFPGSAPVGWRTDLLPLLGCGN